MKRFQFNKKIIFAAGFAGVLFLSSCDRDHNNPGYVYFPDMTYSQAYESYSENPNFANDMTMRVPPEGTVPRGYTPLPYTADTISRVKAGLELKNPFDYTPENLARGKEMYTRVCLQCHGDKGDGKGRLYTSGVFTYPPASLVNNKVKGIPDGQIFHTITYGYRIMRSHASIVRPDDRWKIILYIRRDLEKIK